MPDPSTILLVDDEDSIQKLLAYPLEREGFRVLQARDGEEAMAQFAAEDVDLVVLDIMLPKLDGLEVCKRLRAESEVPIIMLTARDDELDKVLGLELGADDYIVKPFSPKEVVARVRAVLRRAGARDGAATVVSGRLVIDPDRHTVQVDAAAIELTPKEFDLLRALAEARGRVLSREFLLDRVWGYASAGEIESRTVDVHVRRLRMKLGDEGQRITTVKGVGYRLEAQ
jgi:DNA-binding response OmpR family regulator